MPPEEQQNKQNRGQNRQSIITNSAPKPQQNPEEAEFFDGNYEMEPRSPREIRRQARARLTTQRNHTRSASGTEESQTNTTQTSRGKKIGGFGFIFIAFLIAVKMIADALTGLTFILTLFMIPLSFVVRIIILIYYYLVGVRPDTKKVVLWSTATIIKLIPMLNMIPAFLIELFVTRHWHNKSIEKQQNPGG